MSKKNAKSTITRRKFVGTMAAATAAFTIVPRHVLGGSGYTAPSDKLNIAVVGAGGKGRSDMWAMRGENIVAICDVDDRKMEETLKEWMGDKYNQIDDITILGFKL